MYFINISPCSTSDFSGISIVLAVSGCVHKCRGCWARENGGWKYTSGEEFTEETYQYLKELLSRPYIDNICIQGGDILAPRNAEEGIVLCKRLKQELSDKKVVVFTGYTYDQITSDPVLQKVLPHIDVLVDGRYEKDLPPAPFRGSNNQRIIDVKKSLDKGFAVDYDLS